MPQPVKKIYKPLPAKPDDYFFIVKAHIPNKRGPKPKNKKPLSDISDDSHDHSAEMKQEIKEENDSN